MLRPNRTDYAVMLDIKLIERGLGKPGKTKGGLAAAMGVRPGAVSEILSGLRLIKAAEIELDRRVPRIELGADHGPGRRGSRDRTRA